KSFLGSFRGHIESGRDPENYFKYSVQDIERIVLDFFDFFEERLERLLSLFCFVFFWFPSHVSML
ncbi:unnamed protein product, partial [Brassica oleracea]